MKCSRFFFLSFPNDRFKIFSDFSHILYYGNYSEESCTSSFPHLFHVGHQSHKSHFAEDWSITPSSSVSNGHCFSKGPKLSLIYQKSVALSQLKIYKSVVCKKLLESVNRGKNIFLWQSVSTIVEYLIVIYKSVGKDIINERHLGTRQVVLSRAFTEYITTFSVSLTTSRFYIPLS